MPGSTKNNFLLASLALCATLVLHPAHASATIEASGELASDVRDQHGDTIGGIGSGLVYDAKNDLYYSVTDRGAGDGTLPYRPRIVVLKIPRDGDKLTPEIVRTIILKDENGRDMTGLIPDDREAQTPRMKDGRTCIDPEAIALAPDGTLYITDEYGPYLYQFSAEGKMLRRIEFPEKFQPRLANGRLDFTDKAELVSGRNINQGPEGMSLLPDGKTAVIIFQSGLVQENGHSSPTTYILLVDLASGQTTSQYVYPFATTLPGTETPLKIESLSVNDISPLSATRFLVLERDNLGRTGARETQEAQFKAVWIVDISKATDLLNSRTRELFPVEKTLLFNLPKLVKTPKDLSAKWESLAIIPPVTDDAVTLMMAADNDFLTPEIHHEGEIHPFPRTEDAVPGQFFLIRASLPENP